MYCFIQLYCWNSVFFFSIENSYILLHIYFVHHNIYHVFTIINIIIENWKTVSEILRKLEEVLKVWIQLSNMKSSMKIKIKKCKVCTIQLTLNSSSDFLKVKGRFNPSIVLIWLFSVPPPCPNDSEYRSAVSVWPTTNN